MRGVFNRTNPTQQAITDVYDERTRFFLVRYPPALVVGLGLTGILAFGLTAFTGYNDLQERGTLSYTIFSHPWPIYLWFCALIIVLQYSIMRHPSLRRQRYETLIVTVIAMIFEGVFALDRELANYIFHVVLNIPIPDIGQSAWTYTIINFGLIAIFWIDTIRRWIRVQFKRPTTRVVDLGIGVTIEVGESGQLPSLPELVSGDLLAGGALTLILSLIFFPGLLTFISNALQYHTPITTCTLSWPIGNCVHGGALTDPPTLNFMDVIQTLVYVVLGLLTLALTATSTAVGALTERNSTAGQNGAAPATETVTPQIAAGSLSTSGDAGARGAGETVAVVVLNALRAALSRRISIAIDNFLVSLRNVIWPVLIFLGTIAIGTACINIQLYLHLQSDKITCGQNPQYPSVGDCAIAISKLNGLVNYQDVVLAAVLGLACTLCIVLAAALLILSWRVVENTFRFLGLVGFIVLLTFWIFSLALTAFNSLLLLLQATPRQPFPLLGASTLASIIAFLLTAIWLVIRQLRRPPAARPRAVPATANKAPATAAPSNMNAPGASGGAGGANATTSTQTPQTMPANVRSSLDDDTEPLP